jgi:hypothetical protein
MVETHWRYTTADWQKPRAIRTIELECTGQAVGALELEAIDGLRYFAGPLVGATLTEYSTLGAAQAAAFPLPIDGRVALPEPCTAAVTRLHHRAASAERYQLKGFLPIAEGLPSAS